MSNLFRKQLPRLAATLSSLYIAWKSVSRLEHSTIDDGEVNYAAVLNSLKSSIFHSSNANDDSMNSANASNDVSDLVLLKNLKARGISIEKMNSYSKSELLFLLRSIDPKPVLLNDSNKLFHEVFESACVVLVTRGCSDDLAASARSAIQASCQSDRIGLLFYEISDDTPDHVVSEFYSRTKIPVSNEKADSASTSLPVFLLLNEFNSNRNKYVYPLEDTLNSTKLVESNKSSTNSIPSLKDIFAMSIPSATMLSTWSAQCIQNLVEPTLFGQDQLESSNNYNKQYPWLVDVTSSNFNDVLISQSDRDHVLECYLTDCPMCNALAPRINMVGYLFNQILPQANIQVSTMNVEVNDVPRKYIPNGTGYPLIQLYKKKRSQSEPLFRSKVIEKESNLDCLVRAVESPKTISMSNVPSLDFAHPTKPGKMALPTVPGLFVWILQNASPNALSSFSSTVIASTMVPSLHYFNSLETISKSFKIISDEVSQSRESVYERLGYEKAPEYPHISPEPVRLLDLLFDMEAEARVFEISSFTLMYLTQLSEKYEEIVHNTKKNVSVYTEHEKKLNHLQSLVQKCKQTMREKSNYGNALLVDETMRQAENYAYDNGIPSIVRNYLRSEEEKERDSQVYSQALLKAKALTAN
jgi:Thioredoxin